MPRKFFRKLSAGYFRKQSESGPLKPFRRVLSHPKFFSVSRRSVAAATAIGLFVALLPLPGQSLIAPLTAFVWRANVAIAAVAVWLSNPLTMLPIFYFEYRLGSMILDRPLEPFTIELSWEWLAAGLQNTWQPLLLGAMITATLTSALFYLIISAIWRMIVIQRYRRRTLKSPRQ